MKTIIIIALALVALYIIIKFLGFYILGEYQYAIGLVEDYLDGGSEDEEFVREYDKYLSRWWNPISRHMIKFHNMRNIREGKYEE